MDYQAIADLLFPHVTDTPEMLEEDKAQPLSADSGEAALRECSPREWGGEHAQSPQSCLTL